jgi:hypothetical protein
MLKKARFLTRPPWRAGTRHFPSKAAANDHCYLGEGAAGMIQPARVFPILNFLFQGRLVDSRLRASNEHILIVRVPRAGERPGYPTPFFSILLIKESSFSCLYRYLT